jgi:hypothetical protein
VEQLLPESLRPALTGWRGRVGRKLGFATPLDAWFARWRDREAQQFLLGRDARAPQYLAGDAVRTLLDDARRAELPRARQLMSLYVLESWLRASVA